MTIVHRLTLFLALVCFVPRHGLAQTDAEQSLIAGVLAIQQRSFRIALQHCRNAVAHEPENVAAHGCRGETAEILGEFDEALAAYQAAASIQPALVHDLRIGFLASRMGKNNLASDVLTASLSSWPTEIPEPLKALFSPELVAQALFGMLVEAGDRDAALELARQREWIQEGLDYCQASLFVDRIPRETMALLAMLVHPKRADCLLSAGMSLTEGGLVNLARIVLSACIQHCSDPEVRKKAEAFLRYRLPAGEVKKLAESLNAAGYNLHYAHQQPREAIEAYKKAITADPSFPWPYHNIGQVYRKEGKNEQALEWYQKAVAINPNYWRAQINLGVILSGLKRYKEAIVAYRQAVALNPDDTDSRRHLEWLLSQVPEEREIRAIAPGRRTEPSGDARVITPSPPSDASPTESPASYGWWNAIVPLLACVSLLVLARVRLNELPAADKPAPYARLVRHSPIDEAPREIALSQDKILIGQGEQCDVSIPHASIAYEHVCIKRRQQGYVLFDLQSQTGTYVNGRPIVENLLRDGMRVRIGEVEFIFYGATGLTYDSSHP